MKRRIVFLVLEWGCRVGLGVMFIYSALAKLSNPDLFAYSVSRYRMLPDVTIGLFALTMPMLELLTGVAMLFTKWLRESALLVAGMMVMFIIALAQALVRGLEISCGCFGVPSVGGREEMVMALVRDLVLIVPAIWLMFRPNAWLEPLGRIPTAWRLLCLWGFGALLAVWFIQDTSAAGGFAFAPPAKAVGFAGTGQKGQGEGLVVSSGRIRPGEWNADFEGVLAKAEREQRPMILMHVGSGCLFCAQLEECVAGEAFRQWREDRAPLMAFVQADSYPKEVVEASSDFVHGIRENLTEYPYVCVYWPREGVTNSVAFCGRRGIMGGRKDKLLVMELMSALDRALGEAVTEGHPTLESLVSGATVQISARAEGPGGTVEMTPADGILPEGIKARLTARPKEDYLFLDWRRPDGSLASLKAQLVVHGGMPSGCYTARFKSRAQCLPPALLSPSEKTLYVRVGKPVRYPIRISEAAVP
ncbi:MAG: DoxX family membrane protein [Kiritimatiellae bacterium]|nr:DoxX family membrane protein [Kiritimatiellia bacterium]